MSDWNKSELRDACNLSHPWGNQNQAPHHFRRALQSHLREEGSKKGSWPERKHAFISIFQSSPKVWEFNLGAFQTASAAVRWFFVLWIFACCFFPSGKIALLKINASEWFWLDVLFKNTHTALCFWKNIFINVGASRDAPRKKTHRAALARTLMRISLFWPM